MILGALDFLGRRVTWNDEIESSYIMYYQYYLGVEL